MLNNKSINENWPIFKNNILKTWSNLTPSELESIKGDLRAIRKLIISKYGNNGNVIRDINYIYQASLLQCYPQSANKNNNVNILDGSKHSYFTSSKEVNIPSGRKISSAHTTSLAKAVPTPSSDY